MSDTKMIVLMAAPEARAMVPADYIEGRWMEIPDHMQEVVFGYYDAPSDTNACPEDELLVITLRARPNGKMVRRDFDNLSAPVWEIRKVEEDAR